LYKIEQSHGDSQNLVYCVFVEKNCSLQDAMDDVADMVRARVDDFQFLLEKLSKSDFLVVQKYAKGLEWCVTGNLHWYYRSRRSFSLRLVTCAHISLQDTSTGFP
jgi:hypothetical protein